MQRRSYCVGPRTASSNSSKTFGSAFSGSAAILFYTINKRQIFLNGNKRMSTLCLVVFIAINGKVLVVPPDELTAKALWLANTASLDFPQIKEDLSAWIEAHLKDQDVRA